MARKKTMHFRLAAPSRFVEPTEVGCKTVTSKAWRSSSTFDIEKVNCGACKKTDVFKEARAKAARS